MVSKNTTDILIFALEISRNEFIEELKELLINNNLTDEKKKYIKKTIKMIMEDDE